MKEVKAVSPKEIMDGLDEIIPGFVIESVNNILKKKFRGNEVSIKQDEIISEIISNNPSITKKMLFDNKWLDFESIYKKSGWVVNYDKPGYNENYDAFFEFKPKK